MYFLVHFKDSGKKKIIPSKWIKGLNVKKLLNYGLTYEKRTIYVVFYSKDIYEEPDFKLAIRLNFLENQSACYEGFILKHFREYSLKFFLN